MRKVEIEVKFKLTLNVNEGVEIQEIVNELDCEFYDKTGEADIYNIEMLEYDLIDSK